MDLWNECAATGINGRFYSNAIINRLSSDDVTSYLRITAPEDSSSEVVIKLGGNYWGTTNDELINKQIIDFDDYRSLADIDASGYLETAPEDCWPFVTNAYLER